MGARLLFPSAMLLAALSTARLGEHRALRPITDLQGGSDRPTLLFVFQPEDCQRYAGLVRRWNSLAGTNALRVLGLGIGFPASSGGRTAILGDAIPMFPVRYDLGGEARRLLRRIGHGHTPTSVLLDPEGRPVMILPPVSDSAVQTEALHLIESYLSSRIDGAAP